MESRLLLAAGDLDPTFDGGKVIGAGLTGVAGAGARAIVVQVDGKYVVAGSTTRTDAGGNSAFAVARFNPDGMLDPTFAGDGTVDVPFASRYAIAHAVAIAPDGDVVVAGDVRESGAHNVDFSPNFAVARLTPTAPSTVHSARAARRRWTLTSCLTSRGPSPSGRTAES